MSEERIILEPIDFLNLKFEIIEKDGILKIREKISKIESRGFLNFEQWKEDDSLIFLSQIAKKFNLKEDEILNLKWHLNVWVNSALSKTLEIPDEAKKPLTLEELKNILGLTIKRDEANKIITFLSMLSSYTESDQFNLSFRAESSTGKSYIPLEIASLFPKEDVIDIAYASPSAFFHDTAQFDKEKNEYVIDLERKILIFIDMPHDQLLQRLRPLLSHDKKELHYKITDRSTKGKLRTKHITIKGFCSVIFCTGSLGINEQEATRMILLSPEIDQEKIREAIYLKVLKNCNKEAFKNFVESNKERQLLKLRIEAIKRENIKEVVIEDPETIFELFIENKKFFKPRHTRDIERLISIIKALALLNLWYRKREENRIYANEEDIDNAFDLYEQIYEAQELNLSPFVFMIYKEILIPLSNEGYSIHYEDIAKKFYEKFGRPIDLKKLQKEILPALEIAGLILREPDPDDRRKSRFIILRGDQYHMLKSIDTIQIKEIKSISDLQKTILELKNQGFSFREIAKKLNLSLGKVQREFKKCIVSISNNMGSITPPSNTCEFCGKTEEIKEVFFKKINSKRFICSKCLSEFSGDQYEIIINKESAIADKQKEDDTQVSTKIDEEIDRLIFENKIKTITSQGLKLFICNKCDDMFFGKEDILEHLKTHEVEENA